VNNRIFREPRWFASPLHWPGCLPQPYMAKGQTDAGALEQFSGFCDRAVHSAGHLLPSVVLTAAMILTQGFASGYDSAAQSPSVASPVPSSAASSGRAGTVSMDARSKSLCEVMREIHARSGAEVKVPQNLADDLISRSVRGGSWQAAVGEMLEGYNYSAVWGKDGQPLQLTVYGRNQYADEPAVAAAPGTARTDTGEDLLVYDTPTFDLPQKYQGLNPGAVSPVSLPVERMRQMALGEKVSLTLPCGQFAVVHDKQFQHENGDITWVGYLENAGKAYRVIITLGSEGSQGQVVTPDGMYNLDVEQGRNWLVDANAAAVPPSLNSQGS
jgi:hypothetical protein